MKLVLDTNVIIAAFVARGVCSSLFEFCLDACEVIISEPILSEVYWCVRNKIKLPEGLCSQVICYLRENCAICQVEEVDPSICRDRDDLHILGLAKAAKAPYIVTGDKDLLAVSRFDDTTILTPRGFWEMMKKGRH